jgi:guanyl-specific ribonuclease Sa
LEQRQLAYVLGISGQFAVWVGRPPADLAPATRAVAAATVGALQVANLGSAAPRARVAARQLAQRPTSGVARTLPGRPRHAGRVVAAASPASDALAAL